jgi:hypothetical protein
MTKRNIKEKNKKKATDENSANFANNPFSQEKLNEIFKISSATGDRLISRESSLIEFKQSFGWNSLFKYLKTCSAFANTKGGYLVFGIGKKPHTLLGLSGDNLQAFENIDPERLSGNFNNYFSPEIHWDIHEYEINGKIYGLLYISECKNKPVICKKETDTILREGDIYYRYRGRSERIKYPELRDILEEKRKNEQELWMEHIARILKIGVTETGIIDLKTGQVSGKSGSFFIDESLLSQLSFIKEGEFSEVKGKPALKVIGNVQVIQGVPSPINVKKIVKTKGIRFSDIILAFLDLDHVVEPLEYIKQICFESTGFLPVYYFMKLFKIDKGNAIAEISGVVSRSQARIKLLERLKSGHFQALNMPSGDTESIKKKKKYRIQLIEGNIELSIENKELEYCLQAIRMLKPNEVETRSNYIRSLLKEWFNKYYSSSSQTIADNLRRSICWVDEALYGQGK